MIFSGLFTSISNIPVWLRWIQWLCSLKYGVNLYNGINEGKREFNQHLGYHIGYGRVHIAGILSEEDTTLLRKVQDGRLSRPHHGRYTDSDHTTIVRNVHQIATLLTSFSLSSRLLRWQR
mmetsp:Transcript_4244/g.4120  ORF Transcript_4244/g.4120 Transcript_4244/m.4120 type:complete len:120 (-) Transcript_4244:302-661(-)